MTPLPGIYKLTLHAGVEQFDLGEISVYPPVDRMLGKVCCFVFGETRVYGVPECVNVDNPSRRVDVRVPRISLIQEHVAAAAATEPDDEVGQCFVCGVITSLVHPGNPKLLVCKDHGGEEPQ